MPPIACWRKLKLSILEVIGLIYQGKIAPFAHLQKRQRALLKATTRSVRRCLTV